MTPNGKRVRLRSTRLVSLSHRHLACLQLAVTLEDAPADVVPCPELRHRQEIAGDDDPEDQRLGAMPEGPVLRPTGRTADGGCSILNYRTSRSGLALACGMDHEIEAGSEITRDTCQGDDTATVVFRIRARAGETIRITEYLGYDHSRARAAEALRAQVGWTLDSARAAGLGEIVARQAAAAAELWRRADVLVEGDEATQQVVRWSLFQLLQASACVDGTGIGARGLTGKTYEGHYFWDTEIYVMPFLVDTNPRVARAASA